MRRIAVIGALILILIATAVPASAEMNEPVPPTVPRLISIGGPPITHGFRR